jgi:hypothetical protein
MTSAGILAHGRPLLGVLVEGAPDGRRLDGGGEVPGRHQGHREVGGLLVVEHAPVDLGGDERVDQVDAIADHMPGIAAAGEPTRLRSGRLNGITAFPVRYA